METMILGKKWTVIKEVTGVKRLERRYRLGLCDWWKKEIVIDASLEKNGWDAIMGTLIHELTHAVVFTITLDNKDNDNLMFTEEDLCDFFGAYAVEIVRVAWEVATELFPKKESLEAT